jgi:hypothetical protein
MADTTISSSTRVCSMNFSSPARTVAGAPTKEYFSIPDTCAFSGGVQ